MGQQSTRVVFGKFKIAILALMSCQLPEWRFVTEVFVRAVGIMHFVDLVFRWVANVSGLIVTLIFYSRHIVGIIASVIVGYYLLSHTRRV